MESSLTNEENAALAGRELWKASSVAVLGIITLVVSGYFSNPETMAEMNAQGIRTLQAGGIFGIATLGFMLRARRYTFPGFLPNRYVFPLFFSFSCVSLTLIFEIIAWILILTDTD